MVMFAVRLKLYNTSSSIILKKVKSTCIEDHHVLHYNIITELMGQEAVDGVLKSVEKLT